MAKLGTCVEQLMNVKGHTLHKADACLERAKPYSFALQSTIAEVFFGLFALSSAY
jgi:hypothetical protein